MMACVPTDLRKYYYFESRQVSRKSTRGFEYILPGPTSPNTLYTRFKYKNGATRNQNFSRGLCLPFLPPLQQVEGRYTQILNAAHQSEQADQP